MFQDKMFQDTRSQPSHDDQSQTQEHQKRAQDAAAETHLRMQNETLTRTFHTERQNIDGTIREVQGAERAGASVGEVAEKTEEMLRGSLDFDLSRTYMPSVIEDNRNEIRYNVRCAILARVSEVESQREE